MPKESHLRRIQSECQIVQCCIARAFPQHLWVLNGGKRVIVGKKVKTLVLALALILQGYVLLDGAEVIADVQRPTAERR